MDYPKENVIEHPPSYPDLYNIDSDREAWGGVVPPTQTWGNADKASAKLPFKQRVAAGTRSRTCECPGWTSGDGVIFGPTYYNCDSDGNDLTTGKSSEDVCEV
ncbi:unnamed protein product [Clonostachys rosea f. rosea IK726]|uniref:Uncharacterized protein n=1 Tax=Clonostachys rosea f. rosea IK726 TaxID=1349383 RepID=A0ACA9U9Q6_BIOOC|nr:unnamed protein product [Clonostachys rosea f. rosea IK726]